MLARLGSPPRATMAFPRLFAFAAGAAAACWLAAGCGPGGESVDQGRRGAPPNALQEANTGPRLEKRTDAAEGKSPGETQPPAEGDSPAAAEGAQLLDEKWEAIYLGGSKAGHGRYVKVAVRQDGRTLHETTYTSEIVIQRFGEKAVNNIAFTSLETPAGEVARLKGVVIGGPAPVEVHGEVIDGRLHLRMTTAGKTQDFSIPWGQGVGGFFATEASLRARPMRPGEKRQVRELLPVAYTISDSQLEALDHESTSLRLGEQRLLKIKALVDFGGTPIEMFFWTDDRGEVLKTHAPALDQTTYRVTKQDALAPDEGPAYDLGRMTTVPLKRPLDRPHATRRVRYAARLRDGDPVEAFARGLSQTARSTGPRQAEITVWAIRPTEPRELPAAEPPPVAADSAPNGLIQSDDAKVLELAQSVAPEATDPWTVATALEKLVRATIDKKDFTQAFATAAEVARSRQGDCTEHAVLLAALCRARGLPARVAIGLVYFAESDDQAGFAYHMWTEVWTGDRWTPLDATLGQGGIGAAHLKLAHSNLQGVNAYSAFAPVIRVIGRLQLEVLEAE